MRLALQKILPTLSRLHKFSSPKTGPFLSRSLSSLRQSIITDLSQDIDIESIKLKRQRLIRQGKKVNIHKMMEEELDKKCLDFINTLSSNPEQSKMLKIIQLEYSHLAAEGYAVIPPEEMTSKNWVEALTCSSSEERLTYFLFIGHKRKKKFENRKAEKERKQEWEQGGRNEGENPHGIIYTNEEWLRTSRWGNYCLASSMMYGLPLVIDMDYDSKLTAKEIGETAKQLWMAYCANRGHQRPFHLILTGCPPTNSVYRSLELRHLLDLDHFLVTTTEKSYLDLYDKSDLVYLTPHAKQTVQQFNTSTTYILGAYSDMLTRKKMALAKAREQKVRCQRFPIDENIKWIQGNKDLFLHDAVKVLLGVKEKMTWKSAFSKSLPQKCFEHY